MCNLSRISRHRRFPHLARPLCADEKRKKRRQLLDRDGDACFYCGRAMAPDDRSLEHIVDWADGGRNDRANLVLAHAACNHAAQGLTVDEKMLRHGDALLARLAAEMRVAA